ncbi:hypothetical protein L3X38_041617 [Prunus dulcis]|uniref:Reverse transcriptase domain-containing protein n=1 Tax=Prunus dulcis TaxID=3755 RepID=A0AAD4YKS6_PRUDU|nr:hypothetical protein L3X38_041617 [Prunus dulcis]
MALKLDLVKAYDLLDWNYIRACFIKFGSNANWCDRIMNSISTASFSILLNGNPKGFFAPSRGIRQGDPLSPYLFIICIEPFIRHLNKLTESTRTQVGLLSSPHGYRISNLVFADDCLIFAKATPAASRKVLDVLAAFAKAFGLRINFHKSTIYFSLKVQSHVKNNISTVLQIQHRTTIGKYLVSPSGDQRDEQVLQEFLFGQGWSPVAWKEVCMPKDLGGVGVRMANHFNLAALAKLGWKCITDHSNWWVKVVSQKYLRYEMFFSIQKESNHSVAWKSILDARQVLCKGLRWVVGNGGSIPFWTSHWVLSFPPP